jgi:8-oxo-dGTP pyrophosphatase MutT (NUDIX family)
VTEEEAPRAAATVVVLRDSPAGPEVFLVRRHTGAAFRGAHVFPGGRLDPSDRSTADQSWCDGLDHAVRQLAMLPPREAIAFHLAAARELFEEAGVLLARTSVGRFVSPSGAAGHERFQRDRGALHAGKLSLCEIAQRESLRVALDTLVLFSHWVTPIAPVEPRRFDTRFFMTRVPAEQTPAHDDRETTESVWLTAAEAIRKAQRREIVLPPPTWITMRELERRGSVDAALAWAAARVVVPRQPTIVNEDDGRVLMMPRDTGPDPTEYELRFALRGGAWGPY